MASIDKRSNGYRVRWRDPDGCSRSRQCPNLKTARQLARKVDQEVAQGQSWKTYDAPPVINLKDVMEEYIKECVRLHQSSTAVMYARHVENFLTWLENRVEDGAILEPELLSRGMVSEWYDDLEHGGLHGKGRSLETRRKMVHTVERAWAFAYDHEEFGHLIPRPRRQGRLPTDPGKPTIAPTWAEMDACIKAASGPVRQLATVLRFTGLRVQQAMGLRWSDFELERAILFFPGHLGKTRQEKRGRVIPVSHHLMELLSKWERTGGFVITTNRKSRLARQRDMLRAWNRAGVRRLVWEGDSHHSFRNGFVSGLKRAGADTEAVEYLVGHSLGLRSCYTDPDALPLRDAVCRIPQIGEG